VRKRDTDSSRERERAALPHLYEQAEFQPSKSGAHDPRPTEGIGEKYPAALIFSHSSGLLLLAALRRGTILGIKPGTSEQ
jgi:hypothetical protein